MKNKTAAAVCIIFSAWSAGYYTALKVTDPSFKPSFSDSWLALAAVLLIAFFRIRRRRADAHFVPFEQAPKAVRRIIGAVLAAAAVIACVNLFFICTPAITSGAEPTAYIIVLGGGIKQDGTLSEVPRRRIEKAAEYLAVHPQTKAIVTGGQTRFAPCAEAPVLAQYLASLGIDRSRIIEENKAQDTIQNFSYSIALMARDAHTDTADILTRPVTVVTSDFHLARAERIARRMGFSRVSGLASRTAPLFVLNSYCREICSYIKLNLRILLTGQP